MQTETIDHKRRRLLGAAAATIVASKLSLAGHANAQAATTPGSNTALSAAEAGRRRRAPCGVCRGRRPWWASRHPAARLAV